MGAYLTQKKAHPPFGAWSILLVHIWFMPSKGPKGLKIHFLKLDHGSVTMKCHHGKRPFDTGQLRGPRCEQPLGYNVHEECRPTGFRNAFFLEIRPWKCDHRKRNPMTWDNFVVHNVNNPSALTLVTNADRLALEMHFLEIGLWKCDHEM